MFTELLPNNHQDDAETLATEDEFYSEVVSL